MSCVGGGVQVNRENKREESNSGHLVSNSRWLDDPKWRLDASGNDERWGWVLNRVESLTDEPESKLGTALSQAAFFSSISIGATFPKSASCCLPLVQIPISRAELAR